MQTTPAYHSVLKPTLRDKTEPRVLRFYGAASKEIKPGTSLNSVVDMATKLDKVSTIPNKMMDLYTPKRQSEIIEGVIVKHPENGTRRTLLPSRNELNNPKEVKAVMEPVYESSKGIFDLPEKVT